MKTTLLLLLTAYTLQAQEMDTICYTQEEHQKISDSLQMGMRAYKAIGNMSLEMAAKDLTIAAKKDTIEMQTRTLINLRHEINSKPAPKRGWWAVGGFGIGLLTGLILML